MCEYYGGLNMESIREAIKGVRMNFDPNMRKILEKYGEIPIKEMYVCRRPLSGLINSIVKKFSITNVPYDKLFHLFFVLKYDNLPNIILEKNEALNMRPFNKKDLDESIKINLPRPITVNELLYNAIDKVGPNDIFVYDAFSNNCQKFVLDVLKSSDIPINNDEYNFIYQKVADILPNFVKKLTFHTTSLYNRIKLMIYGKGLEQTINNNDMAEIMNDYLYDIVDE